MTTQKAEGGHTVKVHYTVSTDDTVRGTSKEGQPIEFKIGEGNVIPGLENGVIGMEVGESKNLTVPPEEGFGTVREELITTVDKESLPEGFTPAVGKVLELKRTDGPDMRLKITDIKENSVILDANHPLADQTLDLEVEMVEIVP